MSFDRPPSRAGKLGIIVLLGLGVFVASARPLVRPQSDLYRARGMGRWGLLGEPAGGDDGCVVDNATVEPETDVALRIEAPLVLLERQTEQPVNPPLRLCHRTLPPRAGDSPSA